MKYLSFLLAMYILLLSAVPNLVEDKCFDKQTTEQRQNQQDDQNCDNCCSPFLGCDCCFGFTVSVTSFLVSPQYFPNYSELKVSLYDEQLTSAYLSCIWQPPKIG